MILAMIQQRSLKERELRGLSFFDQGGIAESGFIACARALPRFHCARFALAVATATFPPVHISPQRSQICPTARTRKPGEGNLPPRHKQRLARSSCTPGPGLGGHHPIRFPQRPALIPIFRGRSCGQPREAGVRARESPFASSGGSPAFSSRLRTLSSEDRRPIARRQRAGCLHRESPPSRPQMRDGGERSAGLLQKGLKTPSQPSPMPSARLLVLLLARELASRTHHSDALDNPICAAISRSSPRAQGQEPCVELLPSFYDWQQE